MRNFFKKITSAFKSAFSAVKSVANSIRERISAMVAAAQMSLCSTCGEGYVDSGVKILIAVVIGAALLAGLYALFNTTIMPTVTEKVTGLFNYAG